MCLRILKAADNQSCSTGIIFAVYLIVRCAGLPHSCLTGSTSQNLPNTLAAQAPSFLLLVWSSCGQCVMRCKIYAGTKRIWNSQEVSQRNAAELLADQHQHFGGLICTFGNTALPHYTYTRTLLRKRKRGIEKDGVYTWQPVLAAECAAVVRL